MKLTLRLLKQFLALIKSQIQNYDGQCGYITTTAIAYDLLAWQERQNNDDKTLGDLFYLMNDSLPDVKFIDALVYLIDQLKMIKGIDEVKLTKAVDSFMALLPEFIQLALEFKTNSANIEATKPDTAVIA